MKKYSRRGSHEMRIQEHMNKLKGEYEFSDDDLSDESSLGDLHDLAEGDEDDDDEEVSSVEDPALDSSSSSEDEMMLDIDIIQARLIQKQELKRALEEEKAEEVRVVGQRAHVTPNSP